MKCKKLSCPKDAQPGFECCSSLHGADVRLYRSDLLNSWDADENLRNTMRDCYTVEEALTYA